jgi:SAM-dependent methyltransferase
MHLKLYTCQICDHTDSHPIHIAREMMHGCREEFTYFQCLHCGCLQIGEIPKDMSPYYPSNYYSLAAIQCQPQGYWNRAANQLRTRHALAPKPGLGSLMRRVFGPPLVPPYILQAKLDLHSPILDVGCGAGSFLHGLHRLGFTNLTGIDPYIAQDSAPLPGLRIRKLEAKQLTGSYDLIVMNHSFEHMAAQLDVLEALRRCLNAEGRLVLRIPICSSYAWDTYGTNWVQLDAPRHFFLHSLASLELLSEKAGLSIESVSFDSSEFQFWGSEQYQQDIPLFDERSWSSGPAKSIFTAEQIEAFRLQSEQLNAEGRGDQACFVLR